MDKETARIQGQRTIITIGPHPLPENSYTKGYEPNVINGKRILAMTEIQMSLSDWTKYQALNRLKADLIDELHKQNKDLTIPEMVLVLEDIRMELEIEERQIKEQLKNHEK
jgi:hypothetical protein